MTDTVVLLLFVLLFIGYALGTLTGVSIGRNAERKYAPTIPQEFLDAIAEHLEDNEVYNIHIKINKETQTRNLSNIIAECQEQDWSNQ